MALILSSILLWNSGDRKITIEEMAMIDPLWRSPGAIDPINANNRANADNEKISDSGNSLQIQGDKEGVQNVSLITNSIKPGTSSKTGKVDYNF